MEELEELLIVNRSTGPTPRCTGGMRLLVVSYFPRTLGTYPRYSTLRRLPLPPLRACSKPTKATLVRKED